MTEEELKLEALKYLENFNDCANCKNRWGDCADQLDEYCLENGCCFATPKEQDIYLAGAEPREKRIAELEAQLEHEKNLSQCRLDHNEQLRKMTMEAKEIIREYIRLSLQEDKDIDANVKLFQKAETFIKE